MSEGVKYDGGKPPMDLLVPFAMRELAKVLGFGASKYGRHNYRAGMDWSRLVAAAFRHLSAFNEGEDFDKESGLSHLAHTMCCCMMLLAYTQEHPDKDDRYKGEIR